MDAGTQDAEFDRRVDQVALRQKEAVFQKVRGLLRDSLNVDEEEVTANARLRGDLGAESIDFLDIGFRLQKAFAIKIPRGDLEKVFKFPVAGVEDKPVSVADIVDYIAHRLSAEEQLGHGQETRSIFED